MSDKRARLAVTIDGAPLDDAPARALWEAFSTWMDARENDVAGFATDRGYASVTPTYERGRAVLVVKTKKPS